MDISWVVGTLSGSGEAGTVDGAAEVMTAGIREAYESQGHGTTTIAHAMLTVVSPLRAQLVSEGRTAVEKGEEWSGSLGDVTATLRP